MQSEKWVELVGDLVVARVRGEPDADLLREMQQEVLQLAREAGRTRVLYDVLEMTPPPATLTFVQRELDEQDAFARSLRRAIVVPNSRLAYLARMAFGEGDYRVFYSDMVAAVKWLAE